MERQRKTDSQMGRERKREKNEKYDKRGPNPKVQISKNPNQDNK